MLDHHSVLPWLYLGFAKNSLSSFPLLSPLFFAFYLLEKKAKGERVWNEKRDALYFPPFFTWRARRAIGRGLVFPANCPLNKPSYHSYRKETQLLSMLCIEGLYSILGIVTPRFLLLARGTQAFRVFSHIVGLNVSNLLESKAAFIHLRTVLVMLTGRIYSFIVCSAIFFILFLRCLFFLTL